MHQILVYGFPIILVSFEWLLRTLVSVDTFGFIGPTLAATSISFLVPLTKLKEKEIESNEGQKWVKVSKLDQGFVNFIWLLLFVSLFLWFWVCTLSIQSSVLSFKDLPIHVLVGSVMYIISIVLCTIKEVI